MLKNLEGLFTFLLPQEERKEELLEMDRLFAGRPIQLRFGVSIGDLEGSNTQCMSWEYLRGEEGNYSPLTFVVE